MPSSSTVAQNTPSKILVLCPHPDDFDVAGVTLREFFRAGSVIHVVVAPTSSGVLDSFYQQEADSLQRIRTREQEQKNSLLFFGLSEEHFEFLPHDSDLDENGELALSEGNQALIEQHIVAQKPDAIFIPHPNDSNPAHSAMYEMVKNVLQKHHLSVKLFKQMDPKTADLRIDYSTLMTTEDAQWKSQLFAHHQTQDHRNQETRGITIAERMLASNRAIAEAHGLKAEMAEAFEIEEFSDAYPVELVTEYSDEIFQAFGRLTPQLADIPAPTAEHLQALIEHPASSLMVMRDLETGGIIGTITVGEYLIPTDHRAWIEDVILDGDYRGKRLANKLMQAAEDFAKSNGAKILNLTSSPSRVAANRLYQKLDYDLRETNCYRKALK